MAVWCLAPAWSLRVMAVASPPNLLNCERKGKGYSDLMSGHALEIGFDDSVEARSVA